MSKATLQSYNQTPRKVRLVTELVKGKRVNEALAALAFLPKRAAEPIAKLIASAAASAKLQGENTDDLIVKGIVVESAGMLTRYMPRAFGRAALIRRRKSRVMVELVPKAPAKAAPAAPAAPKAVKTAKTPKTKAAKTKI